MLNLVKRRQQRDLDHKDLNKYFLRKLKIMQKNFNTAEAIDRILD